MPYGVYLSSTADAAPSSRSRRALAVAGKIVLFLLGFIVLLGLGLYLFRNQVATAATAYAIDRSAMECTHPKVTLPASLGRIVISPIECQNPSGPISGVTTHDDAIISLDGMSIAGVSTSSATIDQRDRDASHIENNTLGDLSSIVGVDEMLAKGILDARDMYSTRTPPFNAEKLIVNRAGKREAIMYGVEKKLEGDWSRTFAKRVDTPGIGGALSIRNFDMKVTPSRGKLQLDVYMAKPKKGDKPDMKVKMDAERLDTKKPHFALKLD
jgi:hypothetical protein